MRRIHFMVLFTMCWMALSVQAQTLPSGMKYGNLSSTVFGDLNDDNEVNVADINVLVDLILRGPITPQNPYMSIAEFKAKHWQDAVNYVDTITEDEVIHGWVVSSDESGNIYKSLYIMDESGAGITISINKTSLYQDYPIGQEIILSMKNHWVGKYCGQQLIGYPTWYAAGNVWETTFLPVDEWEEIVTVQGSHDPSQAQPVDVSLADFAGKTDAETLLRYQGMLVRISDVSFEAADGYVTFGEPTLTTNRIIVDANGNELIVRNSNYSDFIDDILPRGVVDVVGVLSFYASRENATGRWQLYLRDRNDVIGGDVTPPAAETLTELNEGFENGLPGPWANVKVSGDKEWYKTQYQNNGYAAMTGYRGIQPPFDAWLITPALNIKDAARKVLNFRTEVNGYGSTTSKFEVYVLNSDSPSTASVKVQLNPTLPTAPASGYSGWVESGDIDLSQWSDGVYYIGFRYYATSDANYATWCLDDVKFNVAE